MESYIQMWTRGLDFGGRSRRRDYWIATLINWVISLVLGGLGQVSVLFSVLAGIYGLTALIPGIALSVRRLHDIGRSGFWLFIVLIPLIGGIVLLVFDLTAGQAGPNDYGPDPKDGLWEL